MGKRYRLYSSIPAWGQSCSIAEVDLAALRHNYAAVRGAVNEKKSGTDVIAVVKADAYGHGSPECVRALLLEGCRFFAVSCIQEAEAVRATCLHAKQDASILILGYTPPSFASRLAELDAIQSLLSYEYARELDLASRDAGITVRAHVALDTGMNRIGFCAHSEEEIAASVDQIVSVCAFSGLRIEGMFTHFASASASADTESGRRSDVQVARYRAVKDALEEKGIKFGKHHVCNSDGLVRTGDFFDAVRVGILLYGAHPAKDLGISLLPVLRLKTMISHVHTLLPGEGVSYDGVYSADSLRKVATLPIGYADGLLRAYSGCLVTVHTERGTKKARIVGRICMDQCMIDVTEICARVGDTVTFFGEDPDALAEYAAHANTIDYESLCLISSRVPRRYVNGESEGIADE